MYGNDIEPKIGKLTKRSKEDKAKTLFHGNLDDNSHAKEIHDDRSLITDNWL